MKLNIPRNKNGISSKIKKFVFFIFKKIAKKDSLCGMW